MILLDQMERDLRSEGRLTPTTARAMWAAYAVYCVLLAAAPLLRQSWPALTLGGLLTAVLRGWVPVEEHHLAREFGATYERYRARTPRWLGLPRTGVQR